MKKFLIFLIALSLLVSGACAAIPAPLPTTTYTTKYLDPLINGTWDLGKLTPIIVSVYGDALGDNGSAIVMGAWFVTLLVVIWLRQEDTMIPMMLFIIVGNVVYWTPGFMPEEWKWGLAGLLILLPVAAIAYSYISER